MDSVRKDHSCGVVPVHLREGVRHYLLIQHHAGHWGFPKGHLEKGEDEQAAAARELAEETGICRVRLLEEPRFEESYYFRSTRGRFRGLVHKTVTYFIGMVEDPDVTCQEEEIADHAWGDYEATKARLSFREGRRLLDEAEAALRAGE